MTVAMAGGTRLILASQSATRAAMLRDAGVAVEPIAAAVDEAAMKRHLRAKGADATAAALALAEAKALAVSRLHGDALVIGADQMLVAGNDWFDKPGDRAAAKAQLLALAGRSHRLISAACVAEAGHAVWSCAEPATLVMRRPSEAFLERYLDLVGDAALRSVGAYQLEGLGAQLFERIEGDFFVILGLPLLPLLDFLRRHGALAG